MLFLKWGHIFSQLLIGLVLTLVVVFFLSKAKLFRNIMLRGAISSADKTVMAIFFGIISILGSYIGVPTDDGFANTRAIGVIVAGLVGGRTTGLGAGLMGGLYRYYLGGFSAAASAIATISEGLAAGLFQERFARSKSKWPLALAVGLVFEACHMGLLLTLNRPFEQAMSLVASVAPPMLVMNPPGIAVAIAILENIFREQELIEGSAARQALQIASNTIHHLRRGLTRGSAEQTARIVYDSVKDVAAVAITDREEILAFIGIGADHHQATILTTSTRQTLATGEYTLAQSRQTVGCPRDDCPLGSKIVAPLKDNEEVIGTLVIYKLEENAIRPLEVELAKGLAQLISTQLEVSKGERESNLRAQAEIKALQAQINPHFLFNALNTIMYYCRQEPEVARRLLTHLGNYYRKNLAVPSSLITLDKEINHVNDYVEIETFRFQGKLRVDVEIGKDCQCFVPPLILQPIVENAIKHGLYPKQEGGRVVIRGVLKGRDVEIEVEDDGVGMTAQQIAEALKADPNRQNIGLCNVDSRLSSLFGEQYRLVVFSEPGAGTRVVIRIPVKEARGDAQGNLGG